MATSTSDAFAWDVRLFVYQYIAEHSFPPTIDRTASHFHITVDEAYRVYQQLYQRHALFLEPGEATIRMAHPFSGIPTTFLVHANGRQYYANCAWDALGIPAMLHTDATVEAVTADTQTPVTLTVHDDQVIGQGELIHFPLPFQQWYDDLVFT